MGALPTHAASPRLTCEVLMQSPRPGRRAFAVAATALAVVVATAAGTHLAAAATAGCSVNYSVSSQWPGGFGAAVTVTNLGDPVTSWRLTWAFTAGQTVT